MKDIFQPKLLKEQSEQLQIASLVQVTESNTLNLRGSVEDRSITNDRSNSTENDRRKTRLKNRTTEARGDLKRSILINEVTQDTRVKGTQSLVREETSCQIVIG